MKYLMMLLLTFSLTACGGDKIIYLDAEGNPAKPATKLMPSIDLVNDIGIEVYCVNGRQLAVQTLWSNSRGYRHSFYIMNESSSTTIKRCDKTTKAYR